LAVSDEEVTADIDRMAAADPKQASRVRARYQTAERRNNLRGVLIERKAMDLVIGSANLDDAPFQAEAETAGSR
jgi:FKBP-type peptidyl-prolyl cis-trans isomerase (trigger factor)